MEYIYLIVGAVAVIGVLSWLILRGGSPDTTASSRAGGTIDRGNSPPSNRAGNESQTKRNWIIGENGDVAGKHFHMGNRTVTIGRKPTNFIQLGDSEVSRVHAQLRNQASQVLLVDMNSSAGTYLEGEELTPNETYKLEDGATFTVAGTKFTYEMTGDYQDDSLANVKGAGDKFESETVVQQSDWDDTIREKLAEAGGDPKAAAEEMGVETEVFIQMMKQANISPDDVS
ncbi:MAG: FHA domain-containing protein [Bradymonadaceae bacterium]